MCCTFSCSSPQVQQSALDYYLRALREVQSVSLLNIVFGDPLKESCDVLFKWTHGDDLGAATAQDFRNFLFGKVNDAREPCLYVPREMTGGVRKSRVALTTPGLPGSQFLDLELEETKLFSCKAELAERNGRDLSARCPLCGVWPSCQYVDAACSNPARGTYEGENRPPSADGKPEAMGESFSEEEFGWFDIIFVSGTFVLMFIALALPLCFFA